MQKYYSLIFILFFPLLTFAQRENSTWFLGGENVMEFDERATLSISTNGPTAGGMYTSYTDQHGDVLLYTNGNNIWNKSGQPLANGVLSENPTYRNIFIVPKPGSLNLFYIFYTSQVNTNINTQSNTAVMYCVADINANNGQGEVLEKNKIIYQDLHGSFTIISNCKDDSFWVVGEANWNVRIDVGTDVVLAYEVTASGVSSTPVVSKPITIGASGNFKASPKGDKLVYDYNDGFDNEGAPISGKGLFSFDKASGAVTFLAELDKHGWWSEFSASGNMAYVILRPSGTLLQFDISSGNKEVILGSRKVISNQASNYADVQLGPDGKIYLLGNNAFAVIENPEESGLACSFVKIDTVDFANFPVLPSFPAAPFYKPVTMKPDLSVVANAGNDTSVCVNETVQLGSEYYDGYTYRWEPADFLDDPTLARPVFTYPAYADTIQELAYVLHVHDGHCERTDSVTVTVFPMFGPAIRGSQSVCPGVVEVQYQTPSREGYIYNWDVQGGNVVSGQGSATIQVNWGASRPDAQVSLKVASTYGCESGLYTLPVRINPELIPETPQGLASICLNQSSAIAYETVNTNGSVYTWGISGGDIESGQGSHAITVNWHGVGYHSLWLDEMSSTIDTICYGSSDTLHVRVYQDTTSLEIRYVSVDYNNLDQVNTVGAMQHPLLKREFVNLMRREWGQDDWMKVAELNKNTLTYTDESVQTNTTSYQYKLQSINDCDEMIESSIHRSMLLSGLADTLTDHVQLNWNAYEGWPDGVAYYEVWRKLDNQPDFVHFTRANTTEFRAAVGQDAFKHQYIIKAVEAGGQVMSWSNALQLEFTHPLSIPNVFTPNSDGVNDTFAIDKLELYPDNELIVYNRLGKEIFRKQGYTGEWNGNADPAGVYFYQLTVANQNKSRKLYKGWLTLLR
jgi:gliding motility-associated-like protein